MYKVLFLWLILFLGFQGISQAQTRYASIVMDARTGQVLQEDHAREERIPASLTKMMTLYLTFDALEHGRITENTRLTASAHAAHQAPTRLGLRRGQSITVEQAITAVAVNSANDVAVVLAERLAGSEDRFAAHMTEEAHTLGMADTHFANATGLPNPGNHTTAYDIALLSLALWRDFPDRYAVFQTESFYLGRRRGGRNHNHLLGVVPGLDGIKTGYTRASGYNLATMTERDHDRVIVVVMGGDSAEERDDRVAQLIESHYTQAATVQAVRLATPLPPDPQPAGP